MSSVTREQIIGLLKVAECPASCDNGVVVRDQLHGEIEQCQFCFERLKAIAYLQAVEPAAWQSQQAQGEPFAYCHLDANGKAKELCSAPCADDDPRDTRTVQALYKHPPATSALPEGWVVGNLVTLNRDKYPGLGEWFTQIWCGDDVVARIYGKDHEQIQERIDAIHTASPAPGHAADVRKMVAPDVSELEKAAQKLWRESYNCESDFIQAVVDALSKQEEAER